MPDNTRQTQNRRERWFEEDDADGSSSAPNTWRPRTGPPRWLTMLLLILLAALGVALIYLQDESEPWDADMARTVFISSQTDMSAPVRMKAMLLACEKVPVTEAVIDEPWTGPLDALGAALEHHSAVLDNFRDLLEERKEEWAPLSMLWKIEDVGAAPCWKQVLALKEAEVIHLARRGQEEAAFSSAGDLIVMSHLMSRLDAWPSFMDRALELHERGTRTLARLLAQTRLSEPVLKRLQKQEFEPWPPSLDLLSAAMDGFYNFERKLLLGPRFDEPPLPAGYLPARDGSRILFKPNATLRLFAESFRELKNEISQPAFVRSDQIEARLQRRAQVGGFSGGFNRAGLDYFAARIRIYSALPDKVALARAHHLLVQTLFAVRRYVQREGRLPGKLEDLIPVYLAEPPKDPFSGELLRYNPAKGVIYSVGTDLKDDGGHPDEVPLSDSEEPTLLIGVGMAKVKP